MSFTKIAAAGIGSTETVTLHSLEVLNNATIGGVLTYEDVTNVDSIGIITARAGVLVGSGITLSKDGDGFFTGVTTATTFVGALTGNVTGNISGGTVAGSTGTFSGAVSGTTGTFTGDVDIADKIIHTGDTNTAIRFPEADTVTFETAGFEQVRINNDVQMFIEGDSKVTKLQIHREDSSIDTDDVVGQITFTGRDAGGAGTQRVGAAISAVAASNWDTSQSTGYSPTHLDFYTQSAQLAYSTLTPRVRIASDGKIGINNTSPTFAAGGGVHLKGSGTDFTSYRVTASSNTGVDFSQASGGIGYVYNRDNADLNIGTNNTERLRITSGGAIGVGGVPGTTGMKMEIFRSTI